MLGEKMKEHNVRVWLVNTGWSGGAYGTGERMKLKYTRAMITAALRGELDKVEYKQHVVFGVNFPITCPNVPAESPRRARELGEQGRVRQYRGKARQAVRDQLRQIQGRSQ